MVVVREEGVNRLGMHFSSSHYALISLVIATVLDIRDLRVSHFICRSPDKIEELLAPGMIERLEILCERETIKGESPTVGADARVIQGDDNGL